MHCISPAISCSTPIVLLISLGRLCRNKCLPVSFASRVSFVLELWRDVSSLWVPRDAKWHGSSLNVHDAARPWGPGRLGNAMALHTLTHALTRTLRIIISKLLCEPTVALYCTCRLFAMMEDAISAVFPASFQTFIVFLSLELHDVGRHRVTRSDALQNNQVRIPTWGLLAGLRHVVVFYHPCVSELGIVPLIIWSMKLLKIILKMNSPIRRKEHASVPHCDQLPDVTRQTTVVVCRIQNVTNK